MDTADVAVERVATCWLPERLSVLPHETPFLVMDASKIVDAYRAFVAVLPDVTVHYAMKCNPDKRVLEILRRAGSRFEIASYPELEDLMAIGVNPRDVLFSNPVKTWQHIRDAYQAGLRRFAFDSLSELEKLAEYAPGSSGYVRLKTSPAASAVPSEGKFGVEYPLALRLMRAAKSMGLGTYGIAFHVGSQMEDPEAWDNAITESAGLMRVLREEGITLKMLDMGGGFPAHYGNPVPPITNYADHIKAALRQHLPYDVQTVIEPGRALVADAGVMVSTVIGVAERGGARWAHLDVGAFNGMMEALESKNQLLFPLGDSKHNPQTSRYHVTGPTCDSQDTILHAGELSTNLAVGDRVYIHTAGAYTNSYASGFNGFAIPKLHMLPPE